MDLFSLFQEGADLIRGNSDESTTNLDSGLISSALQGLISNNEGGLDLAGLVSGLAQNGLGAIVGSWLGNGENNPISKSQVVDLLGAEKVSTFASSLGISMESAEEALSEVLPQIVDKATSGEGSIVDEMLGHVGGASGAMEMLGKMFR